MKLSQSTLCMILAFLLMIEIIYLNGSTNDVPMKDNLNYSNSGEYILNGPEIRMDDSRVIARIREKFLLPPSPRNVPYNLANPKRTNASAGQTDIILSILGQQREGFFVESGDYDGEISSNTLYLERNLNWTGLLIEAEPLHLEKIIPRNRKAYLSQSCLSTKPYPSVLSYQRSIDKISDKPAGNTENGYIDVQYFPLYSYLLALNRTRIDYFSLDVEGRELEILRTIPFKKLDIRTMSVEFHLVKEGKEALRRFVEKQGYKLHSEFVRPNGFPNAHDFIFVKTSTSRL